MFVAIFGRQPVIGIVELERVFGGNNVTVLSDNAATINSQTFDITRLGGIPKAGALVAEIHKDRWNDVSQCIVQKYLTTWASFEGKITLGISAYGFNVDSREVQKTGIILKQKLKQMGVSLRLIPNSEAELNTATSHHNKLGLADNKVELLVVRTNDGRTVIAESTGSQNITAYAKRDQQRPKRDMFVGMLPPKLAQIMINLACGQSHSPFPNPQPPTILDPFCGTGVILQEATLMGYSVYGSDLSEKMIDYSRVNLNWLTETHGININKKLHIGDAINTKWELPIDAVVSETYLGQPFSAPPSPAKLEEIKKTCNHIISEFLINLRPQIKSGTPVCLAVPSWRNSDGSFTHLPLISTIAKLGYIPHEFHNISQNDLLYFREDQIVARKLLLLTRV